MLQDPRVRGRNFFWSGLARGVSMEKPAILVVDDEEAVRNYLVEFLTAGGYQVRAASNAAQALQVLKAGSLQGVLLDVVMPEKSGLDVLKEYRESGGTLPVVVLSALGGATDAVRAMKMGATDYLAKPFSGTDLEETLRRV